MTCAPHGVDFFFIKSQALLENRIMPPVVISPEKGNSLGSTASLPGFYFSVLVSFNFILVLERVRWT